jgi:DNA mismatch repair protein MutL
MSIRELPPETASKIAAGEVVERPASVVKELIENAIDAGADEISIRIEQAGRRLIVITDNGIGIAENELRVAVKRHATSKITSINDLDSIQTLGFRGEALASIAAVSRFTLESRQAETESGKRLEIDGGFEKSFSTTGIPIGTRVMVEDLFFNVPARLKFLKKDITERQLISEIVSRYALFYSVIRFSLQMEGRQVFSTFGSGNKQEVLARVFSPEISKNMLEVQSPDNYIEISGFTSSMSQTFANRKQIIVFVNGRLVSDPLLTSAVIRAYQGYLMVGRFPAAFIMVGLDPAEVDVNVHPTKDEIRFRDSGRVFSALHAALRHTLSTFMTAPSIPASIWTSEAFNRNEIDPAWQFSIQTSAFENARQSIPPINSQPLDLNERVPLLRCIGQLGRTYIAAEGPDGLYLIDQHAAHERILFERFSKKNNSHIISQVLAASEIIHIPDHLLETYVNSKNNLESIGFQFEDFGANMIKVLALPAAIQSMPIEEAILGALEADPEEKNIVHDAIEQKIILKICKRAAIKGGQTLSNQEQVQLLRDLETCEFPRTCPHGRPTMIHLSVDLLERQFGRTGAR